MLNQLQ